MFDRLRQRVHMPSLDGATGWLNSEPLGPAELRGHVVLVNFWTLTCINWLRQEPYVRAWSQAYRDDGLVVIGVHTPEFSFEHEIDRVRRGDEGASDRLPGRRSTTTTTIWSAFDNHYWPALYFVDPTASSATTTSAKGATRNRSASIQRLLGVERELVSVDGLGVEAEADWDHLRTPETYLGYGAQRPARITRRVARAPALQRLGPRAASGRSSVRTSCSTRPAGASPSGFTRATRISCCPPERASRFPSACSSTARLRAPSHGVDVDEDGNGLLRDGRMYQLVRQHDAVRERTLEITFLEPGAEAYAFTFG